MIADFFRGYPAKAWRNEIATREARVQAIVDRYASTLDAALHEDQAERMRALTIAGGDVRVAKHLMYGQVLFDTGRIR